MPLDLTKTDTAHPPPVGDPTPAWLASPAAFAAFVLAFHSCKLPPAEFTHAGHVAVAAHAITHGPDQALDRMRTAIRRFNESVGGVNSDTAGYHETLTRLWCTVVARVLATANPATDFEAASLAVRTLGHRRDLFREYYSYDVVASREARHAWIAPDLIGPFGPIL
jgi:hypothetical protein